MIHPLSGIEIPDEPPAGLIYKRRVSVLAALQECWAGREIIRSMAERQLRGRYKQALLGFAWAIITPVALMVAFTLLFDRVANIETHGAPYALFSYLGLIPWSFFSGSVSSGAVSIVSNIALLNKMYCPRESFPLAGVVVAATDAVLSLVALGMLFAITGHAPRATSYWIPVITLVLFATTVGWALFFAGVVVYIRDLRYGLPLLLQLGILATPVAYGLEVIPANIRGIYSFLNPLGPVIDSYRRTILFGQNPRFDMLGYGAAGSVIVLFVAYWLFKRMETGIADVA